VFICYEMSWQHFGVGRCLSQRTRHFYNCLLLDGSSRESVVLSGPLIVQTGQRHTFLDGNRKVIQVAYSGDMVRQREMELLM
jgi:hypothetical protein